MRIEYLEYVVSFSKTGSVSKTASLYGMTYQGMSRALRELEKEVGRKLFTSEGRGLELSVFGVGYVRSVMPVVEAYHRAMRDVASMGEADGEGAHENLYIRMTPTSGRCLLPLMQKNIPFKRYWRFQESSTSELVGHIKRHTYGKTVGIVNVPSTGVTRERILEQVASEKSLAFTPFAKTSMCIMVSSNSDLADQPAMDKRELPQRMVGSLRDWASLDVLDDSVPVQNTVVTSSWDALVYMAQQDRIVLPQPRLALASLDHPENVRYLPLTDEGRDVPGPTFACVYPRDLEDDEDAASFVHQVVGLLRSPEFSERYRWYYSPIF